jgi:phage tail sheath protein FI
MNLVAGTENHYATKMQYTNFVKIPTLTAFPTAGTFTFSGGTDGTAGITDYDYIGIRDSGISSGLQSYANAEEVDINVIACPGQSSIEVRQSLIGIAEGRKDTIALLDPAQGMAIQDVVDWADGENTFAAYNSVNSTYSAIYYDWYKYTDAYNQTSYWAPPSGVALRAFAKSEYWEAPAGPNRGTMQDVTQMAQSLTQGDRDFLYSNRINPITDLPGYGIVIFGQRTGSMYPTSLDRVAVRRTLIVIEKAVTTALFPMLFEPNNMVTWKRAERLIQPFLDHMVTTNRIYEGRVVCNATTNTPAVIDQNQMVVNVFLKMMKYSEQIMVNFILVPTGADISEYVGQSF